MSGFEKAVLNIWLMLSNCYLKASHPRLLSSQNCMNASTLTPVSKRSTQHHQVFPRCYEAAEKKSAFHGVWRENQIVQTRFLQTGRLRLPA